jgi:hypothetical protein
MTEGLTISGSFVRIADDGVRDVVARTAIAMAAARRRARDDDPTVRVTIFMRASEHQMLSAAAEATGRTISQLCREGALEKIEREAS